MWNLFKKKKTIAPVAEQSVQIPEHIEKQRKQGPPFYCGTAFCGHSKIEAAAQCWQAKGEALNRLKPQIEELRSQGQLEAADALLSIYYPEMNPKNWPINRSSREMQKEYIDRAKKESE